MKVKVETLEPFVGVVQSRDYRKPECSAYGEKTTVTYLRINLLAESDETNYCGTFITSSETEERSVAISVRTHRTLETAKDKYYMITCGKAGFQNSLNETSLVNLELQRDDRKVDRVVYGQEYTLKAHFSKHDGKYGMKVKRCFSFSDTNNTVQLVDDRGCPDPTIMSEFEYHPLAGTAEAKLFSMFRFPESNRVHFQCDILVCHGRCTEPKCDSPFETSSSGPQARSLEQPQADALLQPTEDGSLMASYSVFVVPPGAQVDVERVCPDCGINPPWLLYLCIAFGILFLVMLIVNIFLCCSLTCWCVRADEEREKKVVVVEEFDPYAKSWHGSQYGSRYSLNGAIKPMPVPFLPADTSISSTSDYAHGGSGAVQSRPNSRYSSRSRSRSNKRQRSRSKGRNVHSSSSGNSASTVNSGGRLVKK